MSDERVSRAELAALRALWENQPSEATVVVRNGPEIIETLNVVRGTAASLAHATQRHGEDSEPARVARMVYRQACEALAALVLAAAVVDAGEAES